MLHKEINKDLKLEKKSKFHSFLCFLAGEKGYAICIPHCMCCDARVAFGVCVFAFAETPNNSGCVWTQRKTLQVRSSVWETAALWLLQNRDSKCANRMLLTNK